MTSRHRILSVASSAAVLVVLAGCGSDAPQGDAAPSSPATAGETTVAPEGQSGSDQQAGISFEDQSGDGSTAVIDTVSSPQGGFVVVSGAGGTVLGSAQLQVGTTDDVQVALDPPLTATADLRATLYADSDGDGEFDAGTDQPVPAPISGTDEDDDVSSASDPVEDDAEYTVG